MDILLRLIHYPLELSPSVSPPNASTLVTWQHCLVSEIKPTSKHVLRDLMHDRETIRAGDMETGETITTASVVDVIHSLISVGEKPWCDEDSLLCIIDLPSSSPGGLRACRLSVPQGFPYSPSASVHGSRTSLGEETTWESIIVPQGGITEPHIDDWCGSTYIAHISGKKLWLFWPPTESNMEKFANGLFGKDKPMSVAYGIEHLEGLELLLVDADQTAFIMPPGTIHAVLTFEKFATHCGFFLVQDDHFEIAQATTKYILSKNITLDLTSTARKVDNADRIIEELDRTLRYWYTLGQKMNESRRNLIMSWVEATHEKLSTFSKSRSWHEFNVKRLEPTRKSTARGRRQGKQQYDFI